MWVSRRSDAVAGYAEFETDAAASLHVEVTGCKCSRACEREQIEMKNASTGETSYCAEQHSSRTRIARGMEPLVYGRMTRDYAVNRRWGELVIE